MNFEQTDNKEVVFNTVSNFLQQEKLSVLATDATRPWGGFFVIEEVDAPLFIKAFFPHLTAESLAITGKLSPKILVVAPGKRLSWQYHHRRAEIWKLIGGEAGVVTSENDVEQHKKTLQINDIVELQQGERHRLIGLNNWGIIAEIWRHTDHQNPSNEDDIVRLQDDFGR